jgi:hypothetical protein
MPNEILNIQHTLMQIQNVEKAQPLNPQREQLQHKQEVMHLQAKMEQEQEMVQISNEAEKLLFHEEKEDEKERKGRKRGDKGETEEDEEVKDRSGGIDIVV